MRKIITPGLNKLAICAGLFLMTASSAALAQESQQLPLENPAAAGELGWKLVNTAIFAALIAWYVAKNGGRFFNARSTDIQKAIKDATGLKIEADFRYSEIDKKMASLSAEVARMHEQGSIEMDREHERMRRQTEEEITRIRHNAANEVEALRQEASDHLQFDTARRALEAAEQRLGRQFAQGEPDDLLADFVHLVERGKN